MLHGHQGSDIRLQIRCSERESCEVAPCHLDCHAREPALAYSRVPSAGVLHVALPHANGAAETTERHERINGAHVFREHIQKSWEISVVGAVKHVHDRAAKLFTDEAAVFRGQRVEVEMLEYGWRQS